MLLTCQFRHACYPPEALLDLESDMVTVPDSCPPSSDSDNTSNASDTSQILDDNILNFYKTDPAGNWCTVLQLSPSVENLQSEAELSQIATAIIKLQQAEDAAVEAIRTIRSLAPESFSQLSNYISPSMLARLDYSNNGTGGGLSGSSSSGQSDYESESSNMMESHHTGGRLVPFTQGKKETRKESYKIH